MKKDYVLKIQLGMRRAISLVALLLLWGGVGAVSEVHAFGQNYRGPFAGCVVDAELRKPIEGAVVYVHWVKRHMMSGATFYDATEVLTDSEGCFDIPKKWSWNPWTNLVMDSGVIVFKAGYGSAYTHWGPIEEAASILRNLNPEEKEKPGAGCQYAIGDVKFILECFSPEELERYGRTKYFDIRISDDDTPIFLLKRLLTREERELSRHLMIDTAHIKELLRQELEKDENLP